MIKFTFWLFLPFAIVAACTTAAAGGVAAVALPIVISHLIAKGALSPEDGAALLQALQTGMSGNWIAGGATGGAALLGVILSHIKHGKTLDEVKSTIGDLVAAVPQMKVVPVATV